MAAGGQVRNEFAFEVDGGYRNMSFLDFLRGKVVRSRLDLLMGVGNILYIHWEYAKIVIWQRIGNQPF